MSSTSLPERENPDFFFFLKNQIYLASDPSIYILGMLGTVIVPTFPLLRSRSGAAEAERCVLHVCCYRVMQIILVTHLFLAIGPRQPPTLSQQTFSQ